MKPYRSEKAFSAAFLTMIRKHCPFVQRIESGSTGRGIPDIYLRFNSTEVWVELKNDNRQVLEPYGGEYSIPYRPGQRAWHHEYASACGKPVLTIMALKDGFLVYIPKSVYVAGVVSVEETRRCTQLGDLWTIIQLEVLRCQR